MDKDIKITLIATGFETTSMSGGNVNEAEISGYLQNLKGTNEDQLDVPAFLRRAQMTQRHIPAPPSFAPAPRQQQPQQAPKSPFHNAWNR
jgi:hypothetical protein